MVSGGMSERRRRRREESGMSGPPVELVGLDWTVDAKEGSDWSLEERCSVR